MKKFIVFFLLSVNCISFADAQTTRKPVQPVKLTKDQAAEVKKIAADLYKGNNFNAALVEYVKLVNYDPNDMDFNYKLGMCYLNTNSDRSKAIEYFVKASEQKGAPDDVFYQMGRSLLAANLFDEAIDAFEKYKEINKGKLNPKFNFEQHLEYCYNGKEYIKKPVDVTFKNLGKTVNSPTADYACVSMAVDTIVFFSSSRKGNMGGIIDGYGEIVPDVYFSTRNDTVWNKAKNIGININSEYYEIVSGMSSNGDKMLYYKEDAASSGDVFISELKGKTWQKGALMDPVLSAKNPFTGACITPDGKRVYFAANLKGSLGGKDIWVIEKDDAGKWSSPKNLGDKINTKFDEDYPSIWHDGKTLFFASQGHTSIGGFDIFMSYQGDPSQEWSTPMNIGYPVNTTTDNLYFSLSANARTGFVSAIRPEGFGDLDIYHFTLKEPLIRNAGVLFKASILSAQGLPAKDAMCMIVKESTGETVGIMEAVGPASMIHALLPAGKYKLTVRSPKMGRLEEEILIMGDEGEKGVFKSLTLKPNPSSKP